jgi:phospholipid N-methyltransferase
MVDQVNFPKARNLVELGSGTGVITQEILRRMTSDSRLFALEINRNFVRHMRTCCQDPRLAVYTLMLPNCSISRPCMMQGRLMW